ncbi:CLUMA_CG013046, isoform A [Clunio marinus]|uniref:CLUMA_CG013046, isoform A n=1 Tax=Clunio marinus TaxID=568069 RepID=A0A1J1IHJ3_9DIPT|nr:CLUMA_CG013046, isoform A [Clunio marinus]
MFVPCLFLINTIFDDINERSHAVKFSFSTPKIISAKCVIKCLDKTMLMKTHFVIMFVFTYIRLRHSALTLRRQKPLILDLTYVDVLH